MSSKTEHNQYREESPIPYIACHFPMAVLVPALLLILIPALAAAEVRPGEYTTCMVVTHASTQF